MLAKSFRKFFGLVFLGFQPPPPRKITPKIHAQNCRHSLISLSRTQDFFTPIFCSQRRSKNCDNFRSRGKPDIGKFQVRSVQTGFSAKFASLSANSLSASVQRQKRGKRTWIGGQKTNKHKQLLRIVLGTGGGQSCSCVGLKLLINRKRKYIDKTK